MEEGDPLKQPFPFSDRASCNPVEVEVGVGGFDDLLGDAWNAAAAAAAAAVARAATELAPRAAVRAVV